MRSGGRATPVRFHYGSHATALRSPTGSRQSQRDQFCWRALGSAPMALAFLPQLARVHGAIPPCEPGSSRNRRQRAGRLCLALPSFLVTLRRLGAFGRPQYRQVPNPPSPTLGRTIDGTGLTVFRADKKLL